MKVGIPKEVKNHEYRVAITPSGVHELVRAGHQVFVERDCFDIGQPDAGFVGGLGEFMKVAAMLESRGRKLATHSWGAGGVFMATLLGHVRRKMLRVGLPPVLDDLDDDGTVRPGSTLRPKSLG